jgi:ABC-type Fe3+-siderophore transport system permease subunit
MLETFTKVQTAFVGTLGFIGVIVTLIVNATLSRRQTGNQHDEITPPPWPA